MTDNVAMVLVLGISAVCLFSFLAVAAWSNARYRERRAYYRNDAIKKLAEMQGSVSEPVLELLRKALEPEPVRWPPQAVEQEREAFYRNESMKRIAQEGPGALELELLRQREMRAELRRQQGMRMGGWILVAVGGSLVMFLRGMITEAPVYWVGMIPLSIGVIVLAYGYSRRADGRVGMAA
jgi:hypothetical protein